MIIAPPRPSVCRRTWAALLTFASLTVAASAQEPVTALNRQLDRVKVVISASGALNSDTSGPNDEYHTVTSDNPSSTVGVLVDLQYIKSPLVGLELNINHARYAQNFSYIPVNPGQPNTSYPLSIQNSANEYTFGWVFHTPKVLGIGTFVSAGAGTTDFVPTKGGGLSYQSQARFTYYYNAGLEQQVLNPHFGVRASFRQAFFLAPDFETPFLRDLRHTHTTEPTFGFYLHF